MLQCCHLLYSSSPFIPVAHNKSPAPPKTLPNPSAHGPTALVDLSLQHRLLRRTHELLAEYVPLPCWQDVWADANKLPGEAARPADGGPRRGAVGDAAVLGIADLLGDAVFDSQRQVLIVPEAEEAPGAAGAAARGDEVEARLRALAAPYRPFFGRQHLAALLELEGDWAVQALLEAAVDRFEEVQVRVVWGSAGAGLG
jgi:hypothetical protein